MIPLTLAEIAAVVDGVVHGDPTLTVSGPAYVDTRAATEGGLFVAVVGERVDGHDYAAGAHAVLGSRPTDAPTVVVADPVVALGRLARHVLDRLDVPVLALTGSQGKTGTKDYLDHVLAAAGPTVATAANNNNEIGVPLTVLRADATTSYLVVEMGARGIGHIAYLCDIAPPSVAAVLNVGTAHIGEFGSQEAIAAAKGEIVEALGADGTAVLNADDDLTAAMASRTRARTMTFGHAGDVAWRGLELDALGRPTVEIGHGGTWRRVSLTQTGAHQVANAAAAVAMALAVGRPFDDVVDALATATSASRWRMELHERTDGLLVVNDAYNANPASMVAAIGALAAIGDRAGRRTVAVLGEMRELGADGVAGHREVGRSAGAHGIDVVVVVGEPARGIADGLADRDDWHGEVIVTAGRDDALAWLRENAVATDVVLVKASRGAALEVVADGLLDEDPTDRPTGVAPTP
ncbi:UDP-N-acetylmuramoyl-tripeptide--D-alanyl-D-alanine ligase [Nocardioides psychrotolerans]|uniref:UDP-N-acetylmuramoyl-tripeptide--D-alanyl-D-alanine ligase n=1 Tax=Nocardioides psychrotolerans TaxID=1005945 RepID=A0A1I3DBM5_9ACTN|nr:UDP-N-acetylmuramoyl-tripeptide--D-alanyl-D-alanine ligase [Nocardioides psychrotolerans]GEP37122.1 UDP-N-acetylmuramoyl-tripeptide--D-alanyl-D-alanine ligase [Nocardioides psychrotolerans]SFH84160.1 UDP-N-acetylmuramoyl-tripeptide--D-alanyl-D-alanine ligase [Nocardioides psychrotolerans]